LNVARTHGLPQALLVLVVSPNEAVHYPVSVNILGPTDYGVELFYAQYQPIHSHGYIFYESCRWVRKWNRPEGL
jgi:hypothetical protein